MFYVHVLTKYNKGAKDVRQTYFDCKDKITYRIKLSNCTLF